MKIYTLQNRDSNAENRKINFFVSLPLKKK
jgi:hypothetical protein